ncbi:hypothetical protein DNU06_04830 [Putridiphycobacter roseus]|uniref:Bacterial sugar transferase domain-containing protein n=1 Tax=Putridiphycobacter roseus TaxID=2219161 RepID=A0A2W1N105_9FLAO|nr:sugar transferase [Putridiphycobacter roseus]PZE17947.1 hypothetical protein DNU06_04830 [Putridiphycobacter roseus]
MLKWFLNSFFAFTILILLSPFLVVITLLLWLSLKESPFFIQERIGIHKTSFKIFKFKTMLNQQVVLFGGGLRKTGIDEIPQLINIIKGDMVFVGPRPLTYSDIMRLNWDGNYYRFRWQVKPGLTGLAQLSPLFHKKASLFWDKYYIKHQSVKLNFKIIIASTFIPFIGKKNSQQLMHKNRNRRS